MRVSSIIEGPDCRTDWDLYRTAYLVTNGWSYIRKLHFLEESRPHFNLGWYKSGYYKPETATSGGVVLDVCLSLDDAFEAEKQPKSFYSEPDLVRVVGYYQTATTKFRHKVSKKFSKDELKEFLPFGVLVHDGYEYNDTLAVVLNPVPSTFADSAYVGKNRVTFQWQMLDGGLTFRFPRHLAELTKKVAATMGDVL